MIETEVYESTKYEQLMSELSEKIEHLALRSRVARETSIALAGDDYNRRIIGRGVFQAVYAFLDLAPRLKDELFDTGTISATERDGIQTKIDALKSFYEQGAKEIRHSLTAHRQELDFAEVFEYWNAIDQKTLEEADDKLRDLADDLLKKSGGVDWSKLQGFDPAAFAKEVAKSAPDTSKIVVGGDALALARPNTVGLIPAHPDQEKASRISSLCHMLRNLASLINASTRCKAVGINEALWLLFILTGMSIIENLYEDRKKYNDDSLLTRWKASPDPYRGLGALETAAKNRDKVMEGGIRNVRNHFAAHLDSKMKLDEIMEEFNKLDHEAVAKYFFHHASAFLAACKADIKTTMFAMLDLEVKGMSGLTAQTFVAPFAKPPEG